MRGREVHLAAYPQGGVSADDFKVIEVDVPVVGPNQVLVRNRWTSVDPGLRLRLAEDAPPGYFAPFPLDRAMDGIVTVGEVLESNVAGFTPGDTVWHAAGWRELSVVEAGVPALNGLATLRKLDVSVVPAQAYVGPLGGMGLTAYMGLFEVARLKEGDVVWVSAAAGAVGSLVAQFAKLSGNVVIGSAGSPEKVAFLRDELGLDAAFDYKVRPVAEGLATAAPEGIDVYFDSVGGEHLEAALGALRRGGRAALCGAISQYEADGPPRGPANLFQATSNELTLRGYRGSNFSDRIGEMQARVGAWLAAGELIYRETVSEGLESAPRALVSMLAGETIGKTIVHIP